MKVRVLTAEQAASMVESGKTICTEGFAGNVFPEEIVTAIERRFLTEGLPNNLTLVYCAGQGDGGERGVNHFGHQGLLRRVVAGHWNLAPKLQALATANQIEAYNLPQGVMAQLYRETAARRPGVLTHVGLHTFVDPRIEGGKLNAVTTEDVVELLTLHGREYLFYPTRPIDYAILRGTYADEKGNVTLEQETCILGVLPIAQAVKNAGGKVIVQVKRVAEAGSLDPRAVKIPGIYVDAVVPVSDLRMHMQNFGVDHDPALCGEVRAVLSDTAPMPLNIRKLICRRAAMELCPGAVVNLGIGMPEDIATVAREEGVSDRMTLTVESGLIGGVPLAGPSFGAALNPDAVIDQAAQFDFYDGGGLDQAFLGLAECDGEGNINVSRFGPRIAGAGGFIDITQNAKDVYFCGTFTAKGLSVTVENGALRILREGEIKKFVSRVEQLTYSGAYARQRGQRVLYITERAVFTVGERGLTLVEVAPGIDVKTQVLDLMDCRAEVSPDLRRMDERIFRDEPMHISL